MHQTISPPRPPYVSRFEYPSVSGVLPVPAATLDIGRIGLDKAIEPVEGKAIDRVNEALCHELFGEDTSEAHNVLELLTYLPAESETTIGREQFYSSKVVSIGNRRHCVGYVRQEDGRVAPRLFYRSVSEGDWRVAPWTELYAKKGRNIWHLSKGEKFEGGYVRETRVVDELRDSLNANEARSLEAWPPKHMNWLYSRFTNVSLGTRGEDNYWETADFTRVSGMPKGAFRFLPSKGFETAPGEPPARERLAAIELPDHLAPNFSNVHSVRYTTHPQLGPITRVAFKTNRGSLAWHFRHDAQGRVWTAGLTRVHDRPNSYGTSEEITFAGVFDNKPLEYASQVAGLVEGVDYQKVNDRYVDITPLLGNLKVVKDFKNKLEAGGIDTRQAYARSS